MALADAVNGYAEDAQANAIVGTADKVAANAAAKSALEALLDLAVEVAGFDVTAFLANDTAGGNADLQARTDILDFPAAATDDPALRTQVAAAEAEVRDALIDALDAYVTSTKAAVTSAANLSYASDGTEAVAARAAAVTAANALSDRADQLIDLIKAKSALASAAGDLADFINPEPESPEAAAAAFALSQKQETVADEGLVSATAGSTPDTIVITGNVPNQTFTVSVTGTNGGATDDNDGTAVLTTATTESGGQVTTVTILGTPEIGDTYAITITADLDPDVDTEVAVSSTVEVTVDAELTSVAALRAALAQAINFDDILGGAEGRQEAADAAAETADAAAAAKTAADLAAYNEALGFADAAVADAATAAQYAATAAELELTARQAAQDAATAEANNDAAAADAAATIAETAADAAELAEQLAATAAASAELNGNRAIVAASGAGKIVVNGASTSAAAQANRASVAAAEAAAAAGAALQSLNNAEASASDARSDAELQSAEDEAAEQAQTAAEEALAAAAAAAEAAQEQADAAAAQRAAERAQAAEEAALFKEQAEAFEQDDDPETLDAAQALATAQALAASNVPGSAALAADAAEAARNAANKAQTAADAAQTAARGKGPDAQEQADLAQAAATRAAQDAGEAEAAAVVAANADAAVTAWTSGEASEDRAAAALAARDAAAAAARAADAAETANATADQATADAVAPNVALAAAQATVTSRTNSLAQVKEARDAASDGDDSVTTAIEQVWQNAVAQAEQALSDAEDALAQAQAAADAANENVTIAQANADAASQAAAEAASQAAQAASQASFAAAFEINAQGAAQTRVDNFLDDLTDEVGDALTDAKAQATIASQQAALATAAATGDTPDADAAQAAADAAATAAQAALDALLQVAEDLDLPISAESAQAVINAINTAADAAAALDDLDDDVVTTDNLSTAQDAADTTQLAVVASIKAAAASAQQAVAAANAARQVAEKQAAVAAADEAGLDAARIEAAEAALAQAQADAQASADQAAADSAEAASAQASAQTRVSDIQAIVNAATAARTAATTAGDAATDAQTSLNAAQTALATARTAADAAQADFTASADAQTIDPAAYQSVKQANDRAQAALQDALDAVAAAQAAYTSASEAATTADEAADLAELYRDGGVHPDTGATVVGVNLTAAQAALATANTAAAAALAAANTAAAEAAEAAGRAAAGADLSDIQAAADLALADAAAADAAATTAETQANTATTALADIPRAAAARSAAQAAADEAQSAAATAEGVAQTDTVTLDGTIENGDVYRVTIDGDVVSVIVGTDTADAATGITIADVRTALVNAINDAANGATDSVVAAAGGEDGAITLTAAMPGVGFTATASATNNGAVDDQSATASTVTGNLGGATQVAQLDTVTLQGTVQAGDTYSVTINGTVVSLVIPTDNSITTLTQVRDALVTAINDSAAGAAVTASAGDTDETLAITADVPGVAFTATATATDGGGNTDNAAQSVTTTANLRGADDLAAQAATDAETAATTAEAEAAKAETAAETAAASIAAKNANDDAVVAADDAATQAATAKTAAANAALYARTAKAVGDAVSEALSRNNPDAPDDDDLLDAVEAQLETAQVTRVTLSGTIEAGDTFTITVGTTQATFTVTTQTTATEVRDAFIQQLADDDTFDGLVDVSQGATGDSIRLTGVTPGTAFTTTTSATNVANGTNDQAARVQRQIEADQVTQEDTITVDSDTVVADGDSFSFEVAGTTISVSTASGEINVGDDADAVRDALVTAIQNAGIAAVTVAAGGAGALVLTATQAGAAGAFLTVVAEDGPLDLDAVSNDSVADRAAANAVEASDAAQAALAAANAASDAADDAQTAAQAAANQDGAGSVAQAYLTDTQSQVTATNSSVASAVRDAAAAAQSATSAQAQADLAGADVGAIAAAITAANSAAILAADEDADTAAEAAEAALAQAKTSATAALSKAQDAIDDSAEMLELATSFNQITLTGTPAADDVFTLTIDPTPGDAGNGDAITVTVTANDGDTIDDIRDALVGAVNDEADLQGIAKASATSGSGGFVVAAATSGNSIGVTVTEDGDATGAENASELILNALAAANTARTTINDLLADNELDGDGDTTAAALDNVVDALDDAIAATRQTVSVTIGGTLEVGDTLTVSFDSDGDGTVDLPVVLTVGADTAGSTDLADIRDAFVAKINTALNGNVEFTASAALQDGELALISDNPAADFMRITASAVNEDGVAGEAPSISAARTGTEAALRALKNGLVEASAVADVIEAAVDIAGTAAGTARAAADGLNPESAATIVGTANSLGNLSPALDANVPADVVTAAQLLAEIAEGYVPDALSGAATANAQATIAQQAAFQAAAGLAQFEQVINKARNEAELSIQQEARDAAPVAGDDVIGDGDAANGGPVSGDDEVLEDQAITFDILSNDKRADGGDLANATIAAVGQPAHGKITIVPEVRELNFTTGFSDGDTITLTVNGVSIIYTLDGDLIPQSNADEFAALINNTPAMSAVVTAAGAGRGGAITLTSAVPGTPIVASVEVDGNFDADVDTVTVPNGRVTYTPTADYNGTDTFTYTVSNGATPPSFDTATVTIEITATNDNPDAKNDFITTSDDSTAISKTAATGLLANDTDIDTGDSLTVIEVNGDSNDVGNAQSVNFTLPNGDPAVALVTINADGSYTVNPNGEFEQLAAGQSATGTLTYTVSDGHAGTDDQTISLANTVANATGVNQVSTYTVGGTIERGDVFEITVNGTRISHAVTDETTANEVRDALVAKLNANGVIAGKVAASAGGGGEVVITANLAGQAFTTSAQAINAGTDVATLSVTITGSNDAPVADADTASGDEDTTITGTLTATDPDLGDTLTFAVAGGGQATNGTVTIQSDGSFSYVPNAEFSGTDSFTFRVIDAAGIASTATVSITVNNVNDDPVITAGGDPTPTFEESGPAVIIDGAMTIADVDTANFNTGFLRAQVTGNLDPGDHLLIQESGDITLSGSDVLFDGVVIGVIDGTDDGSTGNLLITLDADATPAAVQALARTIAFTNDAAEPTTVARTVTFTVDSGDGGTTTQDATVQVALESGLTRSDHNQLNFSGDWFDAANWTSGIPDATTIAVLNDGGYAPITFNNGPVDETVGQLVVNADLNILAGTLNVLEPSAVEQDATVTVSNASVLGTGDLNIAGTVALGGAATLGLPLITLDAAENGGIHGELTVTGSGNQIDGALAIIVHSGYFGELILGGSGSGNVALDVTLGIVNAGAIVIDNFDAAPADAILTVGNPGIANTGTITFSDTSGGGGQRVIEGSIDTANGTITVNAGATIDLAGGILNAVGGTIDLATATVLTVSDGQTVVDSDTYLSGTGTLDLAGTGSLTLTSDFTLDLGDPELTLSGAITIEGSGSDILTIGDGRSLTLDGDEVSGSVNLAVDGTLTIEGTGTQIAAPTTINSPNGAFTVAPGATVTITAPGFLSNNGGEISVGAGATLVLDGVNIENAGIITGEGTIQLANGADIAGEGVIDVAGVDNIGTLDITGGEVVFDTNAALDIDIGGGASDVLHLDTMDLTAAGDTLNLTFAAGFDPTVDGHTFQVLTYSSHDTDLNDDTVLDNIFDNITHNLGPEYNVTIDYGSTAATVTVSRLPEIAVTTNGAGMQFDGVDDKIVATDAALAIQGGAFTVAAVITTTQVPAASTYGVILSLGDGDTTNAGFNLSINENGFLEGGLINAGGVNSTIAINDGLPHHVAAVHDGSGNYEIFVDGVSSGSFNVSPTQAITLGELILGQTDDGSFSYEGLIDEVQVYNQALSTEEVAAVAGGGAGTTDGITADPLIHFDFADGQAINLGSLGSNADGVLGTSAASGEADDPFAVPLIGQALSFDGTVSVEAVDASVIDFTASGGNTLQFFAATDQIVAGQAGTFSELSAGQTFTISESVTPNDGIYTVASVSADGSTITVQETGAITDTVALASGANIVSDSISPLATGTGAFTYEAWFRTDDPANPQTIIRVGDPAGDYAQIRVTGDGRVQALAPDAGQTTLESSLGTNDGLWHHVAYTHDGAGNLELFLDGVSVATTTTAINSIDNGSVTIGGWQTANQPFFGEIFDVRAYDVARTAGEIQADMNDLPDGTDPALTAAWHLDDVLNGTTDQFRDVTGNGATGTYSDSTPEFAETNLFTMAEESTLHGRIIATDPDDVNDTEVFTFDVAAQGANGTVTVNPADGTWEYTPNADFTGTDSFEVKVTDSLDATATKTVSVTVLNVNDAPDVSSAGPAADFTEDGAPVFVDPALTISDLDSADFDGGTLTIDVTGGHQTGDVLAIDAGGPFTLSSGMSSGSLVSLGQDMIGVIGLDGTTGTLSIDLTSSFATPGVVEQLARAVTFQNDTAEPGAGSRNIEFTLTDGDGGTSAALSQTVNISPINDAPEILGVVQSSNAAWFDGIGDSISLANPAGLPNGAADFTWSAWVKTDATAVNHAILSVGNATGTGTNGQLFIQANGQLAFDSLNVNFVTGGPAINDDAWHHVAVTTSGGFSEIFVDGVSVAAPVDLSLAIGTDSAFIGQAPDGTNQFDGEISDVRIYDVARTVDDIAADMGTRLTGGEPNLVAYYPLDNDGGGFVNDLAGGDNIGTLLGDVTIGGVSPDFLIGAGASFTDSFDDGSLSTDYTVDTTNAGAAATEGSGVLSLSSRAIVSTAVEYVPTAAAPITIETSLQFNDINDFMAIATRSDGIADPGNYNFITNGVYATFGNAGGVNQMAIYRVVGGTVTPIVDTGSGAFTFNNGTTYDVVVTDDGLNLSITVTEQNNPSNTLTLEAQDSTEFTDNHISFLNRENVANGPQIDSLEITQPAGLPVVPEDGTFSSQIVAGDVDNLQGDLTFTLDANAENGTVTLQSDGSFTYTPDPDFNGIDRFSVTVDDGNGGISTQAITLDVAPTNDAPTILGTQANLRTPQFDGIDDFVQAIDPNSLLTEVGGAFTIEAWVQPAAAGTLASLGTATGNQGLEIFITGSGELGIGTDDRTTIEIVDTGNAIDDGAWHHVAVAYDGTTFRLYVDGAETASGTGALNIDSSGEVTFGKGFNDTDHFKGAIDDIRIWSDNRTAQEIADNFQQNDLSGSNGLAARYTLDNTNSEALDNDPTLIDVSGNGHVISAGGPPSDPFSAYAVLDGAGDMINFTQINPVDGTGKITIAAWIKPDDLIGTQAIATIGAGDLVFARNGNGLSFTNAGVLGSAASGTLTAGEWNHVAVTYDNTTGTFETFVNGTLQGAGNVGINPLPAATTMAIGSSNGDGSETAEDSFAGGIAQVRIYDEVRQPADVQADMMKRDFNGETPASLRNNLSLDGRLSNNQDYQGLADGTFVGDGQFVDHSPLLLGPNVTSGAVTFDGVDDAINFGQEMAFEVDTTFTLEAWINPKSSSDWAGIVTNITDDGGNESGYGLHLAANEAIRFAFTVDGTLHTIDTPINTIDLGQWSHVAATYDGGTARIFVNGIEVAAQDIFGAAMTYDYPNDLRLGAYHDSDEDYFFDGEIADVRIWDVARTDWEIENDAEHPVSGEGSGLVFNASLNEGVGGEPVSSVNDAVNNLSGTPLGGPVYIGTGPEIYGGLDPAAPLAGTEDTILRGRIAGQDTEGDGLTFTLDVNAANGSVALNPDGSYEYTPNPDAFGTDSFTVTVSDGFGGTDTRTVYLDIAPVTDVFIGGNGDDILYGTEGDDILDGRAGENILIGDAGDDYLTGGTRGKAGVDRNVADYSDAGAGITVTGDTVTGDASVGTDTLGNIDQIIGSAHDDDFDMTGWDNGQFDAFDPDNGGAFNPTVGDFNVVRGGDGDDTITGNGFTRVDYSDAMGGVTVTLDDAVTFGGGVTGFGKRTDNSGNATGTMDGTGLDKFMGGVNEIAGSEYSDTLTGDANNNVLIGRGGNDILNGGGGTDRADYRSDVAAITVTYDVGSAFDATVTDGSGGVDDLSSIEQVRGSQFDDFFNGNDADNRFRGEGGADTFTGGDGDDRFEYTRGDESVDMAYDTITDFTSGADTIRFKGMDGLELMTVEYDHAGPVQATVDAIAIDDGVQDRVVFFTINTDGYLYVKGRGTGTTNYDGTLIKLDGVTTPLAGTDVRDGNGTALIETTAGTNTIAALTGQQTHTGGAGPDYFVFTAETDSDVGIGNRDTITDFVAGEDKIVLEGVIDDGRDFSFGSILDVGLGSNAMAGFGLASLSDVLRIDTDGDGLNVLGVISGIDMEIEFSSITGTLDTDDFIIITTGTTGDDSFVGRTGNDWILASATTSIATDVASVTGGDTINLAGGGSGGDDTLIFRDPMEFVGAEWSGTDLMFFYEDTVGLDFHKVTVTNQVANPIEFVEFEFNDGDDLDRFAVANGSDASGGADNTLVAGGSGIDTLIGTDHNDILLGNDGDDNLDGGDGDDLLIGGAGEDILDGGAGNDTVSYFQNPTNGVIVNLSNTTEGISPEAVSGGTAFDPYSAEIDTLINIENAEGSSFEDFLIGSDGANRLSGDAGDDHIYGGGGADILEGGAGMDVFIYGSTEDSGFDAALRDVILDFDAIGADKIDISAFNQGMFMFVGDDTNDFAGFGASSARFNNETKILEIDADGDAQADMEIELQNVNGADLDSNDFVVSGGQIA